MAKLQGLADYAAKHARSYRRTEAVAETGGRLRMLDLTRAEVRDAVTVATSAEALYKSAVAGNYE